MSEPPCVAETLAWCNARRKERGMKPLKKLPRGRAKEASSCPCGKATGLLVYASNYREKDGTWLGHLPPPVQLFVDDFDNGRFPQYQVPFSPKEAA